MIYPWQADDWRNLQALRGHWPHALLLQGQAGIGKLDFARHLAQSLLCEAAATDLSAAPTEADACARSGEQSEKGSYLYARPCGACAACRWFKEGNHPDFRAVCPASAASASAERAAAAGAGNESSDRSAANHRKTHDIRALSKEIKIDDIRALLDFCHLGSHRSGMRVVLLYPADALNVAAANALLKTLEEPPPSVAFILVTARPDQLPLTIVSRCHRWPLATPAPDKALAWLAQQGVSDPAAALAEAGGAPLAAFSAAKLHACEEQAALRRLTLDQLAAGAACDAFACSEALQKTPVPVVLGWLQRWLYDLLAQRTAGRLRYYPREAYALAQCSSAVDPLKLARYMRIVARQRAVENHPLNARLVFEMLFLDYRSLYSQAH